MKRLQAKKVSVDERMHLILDMEEEGSLAAPCRID